MERQYTCDIYNITITLCDRILMLFGQSMIPSERCVPYLIFSIGVFVKVIQHALLDVFFVDDDVLVAV